MPLIRPKHVVSFSSEDVAQPAHNLLKAETYRKWKCAKEGEKQASVILELEKATKIHAIDIGNNGSALVEVLVGRSSCTSDEQYQVLLVTSSFMSPAESKSFTNTNRVRMFGSDKLSKPVASQKWDRIKLVCTQPFNKNEQYGLSFVNLHSPPEDNCEDSGQTAAQPSISTPNRLGNFTLKDDCEEKGLAPGSLFFKKLQKKPSPPPMSVAAQVRATSIALRTAHERKSDTGSGAGADVRHQLTGNESGQKAPKSVSDKIDAPARASPKPEEKSQRRSSEKSKRKLEDSPVEQKRDKLSSSKRSGPSPPPAKRTRGSPTDKASRVAFEEILKGVVFVLSGFVNPERASLRDKATQMGAQYKPVWGNECTHLICAFANTPKFFQVKGKGKIVTKKWISDCFKGQRRLPTRSYHLPGDSSSSEESDQDDPKPKMPPSTKRTTGTNAEGAHGQGHACADNKISDDKNPSPTKESESFKKKKEPISTGKETGGDEHETSGDSADDELHPKYKKETKNVQKPLNHNESSSSEHDTEDELKRVQAEDDIYGGTTDEEQEETTKQGSDKPEPAEEVSSGTEDLPTLPDFFSHKHFLLYGDFDGATRRSMIRYITAYNGFVEEYMNDNVDFVITEDDWDENFDEALQENASLAFVRPKWIMACHERGALVPFQPYIIVPS